MQTQITTRADSRSDLCRQKTENNKQPIAGRNRRQKKAADSYFSQSSSKLAISSRSDSGSCSSCLCASNGLPAPRFTAGMPSIENRATSVQPSLARGSRPVRSRTNSTSDCASGDVNPGRAKVTRPSFQCRSLRIRHLWQHARHCPIPHRHPRQSSAPSPQPTTCRGQNGS